MKTITLKVNGEERQANVEPRTSLADFLREELLLTGTHIGCEHGVCGACTVNIDGAPARSCITYAVTCDESDIRTIEGFDDDGLMSELRQAFSTEHALQCGFCTPGMLITARDIVERLDEVDDERIRVELSGNLCRCTGYVGIVNAIRGVIGRRGEGGKGTESAPSPKHHVQPIPHSPAPSAPAPEQSASGPIETTDVGGKMTVLEQTFTVNHPRGVVWEMFADLPNVVTCMPGASLAGLPDEGHFAGRIAVKLGPIHADFTGEGDVELNDEEFSGAICGYGLDSGHSSRARGEVNFVLAEEQDGSATRVDVVVAFSLSGTLAQFSRAGIVNAVADRLVERFAANLEAVLGETDGAQSRPADSATELDMGSLVFSVMWNRIKAIFGSIFGRP